MTRTKRMIIMTLSVAVLTSCVFASLGLLGCSEPTAQSDNQETGGASAIEGAPVMAPLLASGGSGGEDCLAVPQCALEGSQCVCQLDGIEVNVPGGDGDPGSGPAWPYPPDPPGFPDPDFGSWPEPPGGGTWPNLPPPGPGECDPYAFVDGCFWTASLTCNTGVTRGSTGGCTFQPPSDLNYISGWSFTGTNISHSESWTGTSWSGPIIESGNVRVDFVAGGRPASITSRITVAPRTTGIWTQTNWESNITFVPAQGGTSCGPSRPVSGVKFGWTGSLAAAQSCRGQRIEPVGSGGYALIPVPSGPNKGGRYVSTASFYFESTSQLSPGVFPGAPADPLTDPTQQSLCGTATINFWNYNNTCAQVAGWSGFIQAAWDHEEGHFTQAETELKKPGNNIYLAIEGIVRQTDLAVHQQVTLEYNRIQNAAQAAGGAQPTGHWTTPFWIWQSLSSNIFLYVSAPNFQRRVTFR